MHSKHEIQISLYNAAALKDDGGEHTRAHALGNVSVTYFTISAAVKRRITDTNSLGCSQMCVSHAEELQLEPMKMMRIMLTSSRMAITVNTATVCTSKVMLQYCCQTTGINACRRADVCRDRHPGCVSNPSELHT